MRSGQFLFSLCSVGVLSTACSQPADRAEPGANAVADVMPSARDAAGVQSVKPPSGSAATTSIIPSAGSRASSPSSAAAGAGSGIAPNAMADSGGAAGGSGPVAAAGGHSAAAGASGATATGQGAASPRRGMWRIAMLGDSITETTCMPQLVWSGLRAEGVTNFDFVGTKQNQQGCGVDNADRDCEGHSGYLVTEIASTGPKAAELPLWCMADRADLVMLHFGTNDAWHSDIPIADILSAYSDVVAALRAAQPHVIVLVAQIISLRPDNCADCESRVRALNDAIPRWAESVTTPDSPMYVVDQWKGFDPVADARDGVHPNMQGSQKMAEAWLAALRAHNIF